LLCDPKIEFQETLHRFSSTAKAGIEEKVKHTK